MYKYMKEPSIRKKVNIIILKVLESIISENSQKNKKVNILTSSKVLSSNNLLLKLIKLFRWVQPR